MLEDCATAWDCVQPKTKRNQKSKERETPGEGGEKKADPEEGMGGIEEHPAHGQALAAQDVEQYAENGETASYRENMLYAWHS